MPTAAALRRAIFPLLILAVILGPFFLVGDRIETWSRAAIADADAAALALLTVALLAGDLLLPVPSSLVSLAAGGALGLWLATATIWTGMTLGCLIGWAMGRGLLAPRAARAAGTGRVVGGLGRLGPDPMPSRSSA